MEIINGYVGCMFSGKSNELMREYEECLLPKIYIKFSLKEGAPYTIKIKSHSGKEVDGWMVHKILDMQNNSEFKEAKRVFLDEIHFEPDLGAYEITLKDKSCSFASIDMDSYGHHFSIVGTFLCMAENIYKKHGTCSKGSSTMYSYRVVNDGNSLIENTGSGFKPICKKCFLRGLTPHD